MDWNAIGAIGQMLGSVAVFVTLIYLAAQIRQNTTSVRAATFQNIIGLATAFSHDIAKDPELWRVFFVGSSGELVGDSDRWRFHNLMLSYLRRYENIHYQSTIGLLDDRQWEGLRQSLLRTIRQLGFRRWWKENATTMNADFRAFIDAHLAVVDDGADAKP